MLLKRVRSYNIAERDTAAVTRANYSVYGNAAITGAFAGRGYVGGMAIKSLAGNPALSPFDVSGTNLSLDGRGVTAGVNLGPTGFAGDPGSGTLGIDANGFPAQPQPIQGVISPYAGATVDADCLGLASNDAEADILGSPQSGAPNNAQSSGTASKTPYEGPASEHELAASILRDGSVVYPWLYAGATPLANIQPGYLGAIELTTGKWIFAAAAGAGDAAFSGLLLWVLRGPRLTSICW